MNKQTRENFNLQIREYQQSIINFTDGSPLPVEVKRLALADIASQYKEEADRAVEAEFRVREEERKKKEGAEHGITE